MEGFFNVFTHLVILYRLNTWVVVGEDDGGYGLDTLGSDT